MATCTIVDRLFASLGVGNEGGEGGAALVQAPLFRPQFGRYEMKRFTFPVAVVFFALVLTAVAVGFVEANTAPPLLVGYPVPGHPHRVAVEAPGYIWFTMPDQNMIGQLVVTSTVEYDVVTYTIPTDASEPYDLDYADGAVWFTERTGNKIGRLNTTTGEIDEFSLLTPNSRPTGIDVVPGSPTQVWFAEQYGNNLGQLVVTSTMDYSYAAYSLPAQYPNAEPQDVCVENTDSIWFTAPGVKCIGNLDPSHWNPSDAFTLISDPRLVQPWAIEMDGSGYPWFTDLAGNQIGIFFPETQGDFRLYNLPSGESGPYDLAIYHGFIWFTERDEDRAGQRGLSPSAAIREFAIPSARPLGLAVDANGHIWIAENSTGRISEWQPPYFRFLYLPLTLKDC